MRLAAGLAGLFAASLVLVLLAAGALQTWQQERHAASRPANAKMPIEAIAELERPAASFWSGRP